jgi:hypothetical protein
MIQIGDFLYAPVIQETYLQMLTGLKQAVPVDGLILEFGVYKGDSITRIASACLKSLVHGFDSFVGLPREWTRAPNEVWPAGHFNLNSELPKVPANVRIYPGWFNETLPPFLAANPGPIRFINVDSDIYQSAKEVLMLCNKQLQPGAVIYFDEICDWGGCNVRYPGWPDHEYKALVEWCTECKREVRPISRNGSFGASVVVCV